MKTNFFSAAAAAALIAVAGFAASAFGQGPAGQIQPFGQGPAAGAPQPGGQPAMRSGPGGPMSTGNAAPTQLGVQGIAVVDVAYIFKNHQRFKQQMEQMKAKVDAAEQDLKKDQDEMKKMMDQMKAYQPGSVDYKKMEEEILKKQGAFNLKKSLQGKEFMEQEGQIYYKVSLEIDDAVKILATRNNVALVLKFNGDPIDANDRNEILRSINKPIVFFDPHMDITGFVLQELNRANGVTMNPGGSMAPPQPGRR